uniref:Putative secreted protein n=1 Tax=Anopheles darlingi TaxID=43151 RepID=A0A2M4D2X6_ANODA
MGGLSAFKRRPLTCYFCLLVHTHTGMHVHTHALGIKDRKDLTRKTVGRGTSPTGWITGVYFRTLQRKDARQ